MSLILTGSAINKKVYQDDTNYHFTVEVKKTVQPLRRRILGQATVQHVQVHEYVVRDVECLQTNVCDPSSKVENPVVARLRISGGVTSEKLEQVYATLLKAVAGSGGVSKPTLSAVESW